MKNQLKSAFKEAFLELGKLYQEQENENLSDETEAKKRDIQQLDHLQEDVKALRKDMDATFNAMHELRDEFQQKNKPNYSLVLNDLRVIVEQLDTRLLIAELKLAHFFEGKIPPSENTTYKSITQNLEQVKKKVEAEERLAQLYSKLANKNTFSRDRYNKHAMTPEKAKGIYQSTVEKEKNTTADKADQELKQKITGNSEVSRDKKSLYEEFDQTFEDLKVELRADDPKKYHELFGDYDEYQL